MLKIFSRDHQPEVEGDDITVVVAAVRKKQTMRWRMRRCASRLCHNQLVTNVEGRSFILLFIRHLSRMLLFCCCCWWRREPEVALLTIVEMGTALPILLLIACFVPMIRFIRRHITKDNYPRSDKEHNPTIAIIQLISSCRPTDCGDQHTAEEGSSDRFSNFFILPCLFYGCWYLKAGSW